MRKLHVGIDIDDVIAEYVETLNKYYNKVYDDKISLQDITSWELKEAYKKAGTTEAVRTVIEGFIHHPSFMQMPEVPGAVPSIQRLISEGNSVSFVSARGSKAIDNTYKWFHKHRLPLKNIYFNREKEWLVDKLGIDAFIDDGMHNLNRIAKGSRAATILYDRPWNRFAEPTAAHYRAKDWRDVMNTLGDIQKR